ncbi:MAG: cupredoxin domain-containing protein [Nitrospirae bacterium]|nr:cupredoxin domain-containing protein [Nitrospirota bacterium]
MRRSDSCTTIAVLVGLVALLLVGRAAEATSDNRTAQEQRIEIAIKDSAFLLTQPAPVRQGIPTVIILRNQDIVRHGFTSAMLSGMLINGDGEGMAVYGKGVEGFYVDPGKTLVIRFTAERPGSFTFRCDLHPKMKGEFFLLEIPTA